MESLFKQFRFEKPPKTASKGGAKRAIHGRALQSREATREKALSLVPKLSSLAVSNHAEIRKETRSFTYLSHKPR